MNQYTVWYGSCVIYFHHQGNIYSKNWAAPRAPESLLPKTANRPNCLPSLDPGTTGIMSKVQETTWENTEVLQPFASKDIHLHNTIYKLLPKGSSYIAKQDNDATSEKLLRSQEHFLNSDLLDSWCGQQGHPKRDCKLEIIMAAGSSRYR